MSFAARPTDRGAMYGRCFHHKPGFLRWDPHDVCIACTGMPKMEAAMFDFLREGVPTCRYCSLLSREYRKRWIDAYRDFWGLEPWSGEAAEFH